MSSERRRRTAACPSQPQARCPRHHYQVPRPTPPTQSTHQFESDVAPPALVGHAAVGLVQRKAGRQARWGHAKPLVPAAPPSPSPSAGRASQPGPLRHSKQQAGSPVTCREMPVEAASEMMATSWRGMEGGGQEEACKREGATRQAAVQAQGAWPVRKSPRRHSQPDAAPADPPRAHLAPLHERLLLPHVDVLLGAVPAALAVLRLAVLALGHVPLAPCGWPGTAAGKCGW